MSAFLGGSGGGGGGGGRVILTGDTGYYVAATGNDSNPGTLVFPWLTLQHADNVISSTIDFGGFNITVNIGAGSFAGFGFGSKVGGGNMVLIGAGRTSTTITAGPNDGVLNGGECISTYVNMGGTTLYWSELTLEATSNNCCGLYGQGTVNPGMLNPYGTGDIGFIGTSGSFIVVIANPGIAFNVAASTINISGNCNGFVSTGFAGLGVTLSGAFTIAGTPTYASAFVSCDAGTGYLVGNCTFSGSAHGPRFFANRGGIVDGAGGGLAFFPGDVAGTVSNGGLYLG